jgi:CubicO group peptidase (beta-lactamase class C family)
MTFMSKPSPVACAALLASCLIATAPACAQGDAFAQRFDAVLSQHGVVGGGIAIVHMQEPATQWFFGKARKDTQQPVDEETSYNWASITKTMTAIAILQLRDRGKLSLDDRAVLYVPELRQVHDEFGSIDDITIRDLLTHSAGFRNPTWPWDCEDASNCDWQPFEPTQWSQVAAMLPYTRVAFRPGSRWSYSNLGHSTALGR